MEKTTLMQLLEVATPYDEGSHNKNTFIEVIRENPELEESFEEQYSEEFAEKVREKGIKFIVNYVSMKRIVKVVPQIRVHFCGQEEEPTISIDF